ncbi:unnamed protein product, partial [Closterium sp. NIES-53]
LRGKRSAVAGVTSAEVSNEISDCGKGGKVREQARQHEAAEGSSGRGGVARYDSVIQRLSSLVLAKVRALSRRQVTTNSKASNSVTSGPLRANHRGGDFSSDLLRAFCRAEGIRQTFTLSASPQQNGIAERRIGMVMDVARTSMIHAAAPHFLWPFAVHYAAHHINLQPRVSLPETTPTLRWTGKVGDASVFRVRGSRALSAMLPRTS